MSNSTTKKVYLRRLDSSLIEGYISPQTFLRPEGVELIRRTAQAVLVPYREIRAVYFVRDFEGVEELDEKKVFASRPKMDGLWVRLTFNDDEVYEGVIPNDLTQLGEPGVTITPPDAKGLTQKIFVPLRALRECKVLGVIGGAARGRSARRKAPAAEQIRLFNEERASR